MLHCLNDLSNDCIQPFSWLLGVHLYLPCIGRANRLWVGSEALVLLATPSCGSVRAGSQVATRSVAGCDSGPPSNPSQTAHPPRLTRTPFGRPWPARRVCKQPGATHQFPGENQVGGRPNCGPADPVSLARRVCKQTSRRAVATHPSPRPVCFAPRATPARRVCEQPCACTPDGGRLPAVATEC